VKVTEDTWIIADTHFGHTNIIRYCNRPIDHDRKMLNAWKRLVKKNDVVLHLGDLCIWYGPWRSHWLKKVSKLKGDKYIIWGNHDRLPQSRARLLSFFGPAANDGFCSDSREWSGVSLHTGSAKQLPHQPHPSGFP